MHREVALDRLVFSRVSHKRYVSAIVCVCAGYLKVWPPENRIRNRGLCAVRMCKVPVDNHLSLVLIVRETAAVVVSSTLSPKP